MSIIKSKSEKFPNKSFWSYPSDCTIGSGSIFIWFNKTVPITSDHSNHLQFNTHSKSLSTILHDSTTKIRDSPAAAPQL